MQTTLNQRINHLFSFIQSGLSIYIMAKRRYYEINRELKKICAKNQTNDRFEAYTNNEVMDLSNVVNAIIEEPEEFSFDLQSGPSNFLNCTPVDIPQSSSTMKAKHFVYAKKFVGEPKLTDFELVEEDLPALKDGEILTEAEYLSVDPYMRPYMASYPIGSTMIGGQVAKIIETKNDKFPKGSYVFGQFGWRSHTVHKPNPADPKECYLLPNFGDLPRSLGLGYLGMPGNTAYFGFLEICKPKEGETVVVSGAAGAVGTLVGQIAKLNGCKVIGFAGSKDKCDWIVEKLGFDHAINYKDGNLQKSLKDAAPNGVDCYFDNTGGEISSTVISQMNLYGRISVCGSISSYNADPADWPKMPHVQPTFVFQQLTMQGFIVWKWADRWFTGIEAVKQWINESKIKYDETVTEGFENMPTAFIEMLRGKNFGKAIVKV